MKLTGGEPRGPLRQLLALFLARQIGHRATDLHHGDPVDDLHQRSHQRERFHAERVLVCHRIQHGLGFALEDRAEQPTLRACIG